MRTTAAPDAPPLSLLDPELCPPLLDEAEAPDLESILDSVYRTPQGEAPRAEESSAVEPLAEPVAEAEPMAEAEAPQNFPLVIVKPSPQAIVRRRRRRPPPLFQRLRENKLARLAMYGLWALALAAAVLTLLQLAR